MQRLLLEQLVFSHLAENEVTWFNHCLRSLGFLEDAIQENYLIELYKATRDKYQNRYKIVLGNGVETYEGHHEKSFAYITYGIIKGEMQFKKSGYVPSYMDPNAMKFISNYVTPQTNHGFVTATDISSYAYCPASYCIKKSFVEDEISEETKAGAELHESNRLLMYAPGEQKKFKINGDATNDTIVTNENKSFFDDVKSSEIYYVGHSKQSKKYFKSTKGNFVGQPDYVFINKLGDKYVVEEKFRDARKEVKDIRPNHKAQIISYVNGIDEISAQYGYLVYWYYAYEDKVRKVKKCTVFRVEKLPEDKDFLRDVYKSIIELADGLALDFDSEGLNAAKCANCVVRKFCGHKTGRFSDITVPYANEYYALVR